MRRLAAILALLPACSFAFVSGPPPNAAQLPYFTCTESRAVPVLDTIWTALMVLDVIALGTQSDADWAKTNSCAPGDTSCPAISRHGALAIDAVMGAAGAAGLIYGFTKTGACRSAKAEAAARQQQWGPQPYGPQSWPPPQQGAPGTWPPPSHGTPAPQAPQAPQGPQTWPPQQPAPAPTPAQQPAPAPAPAPQPAPAPAP
jgi:hypothetical protein